MASLAFVLVKGDLANLIVPDFLDVDLVSVLLAHLYVKYGKVGGGIFALTQGFLIDIFSADPLGLFALLYVVVFLGLTVGDSVFDMSSPGSLFMLVSILVFLKEILLVGVLKAFSIDVVISSSTMAALAVSALLSGIMAPLVFFFLDSVSQTFRKDAEEVL